LTKRINIRIFVVGGEIQCVTCVLTLMMMTYTWS